MTGLTVDEIPSSFSPNPRPLYYKPGSSVIRRVGAKEVKYYLIGDVSSAERPSVVSTILHWYDEVNESL